MASAIVQFVDDDSYYYFDYPAPDVDDVIIITNLKNEITYMVDWSELQIITLDDAGNDDYLHVDIQYKDYMKIKEHCNNDNFDKALKHIFRLIKGAK